MNSLGLDNSMVERLKLLYVDLVVKLNEDQGGMLDLIKIVIGLKQGCPLSP